VTETLRADFAAAALCDLRGRTAELETYRETTEYAEAVRRAERYLDPLPQIGDRRGAAVAFVEYQFRCYTYAGVLFGAIRDRRSGRALLDGLPGEFEMPLASGQPLIVATTHCRESELLGPVLAHYVPVTQIVTTQAKAEAAGEMLAGLDYVQIDARRGWPLAACARAARSGRLLIWAPDVCRPHGRGPSSRISVPLRGAELCVGNSLDLLSERLGASSFLVDLEMDLDSGLFKLDIEAVRGSLVAATFERVDRYMSTDPGAWTGLPYLDELVTTPHLPGEDSPGERR
jgi:hypothetical protein